MAYQDILFEVEDGIATITLNRPEQLNAFTPIMLEEVAQAVEEARDDDAIRVLVLTGAGRAFCSGGHVKTMGQAVGEAAKTVGRQRLRGIHQMQSGLHNLNKPTIAAVNGPAIGAGAGLALACDLLYASDRATFVLPFSKIGFSPDAGLTWLLPRLVGMARAMEIIYLAETIDADRALRLGLVNDVVSADQLLDRAHEVAARLAQGATVALGTAKRAMHAASSLTYEQALALEAALQEVAGATADSVEGVAAFLEKRAPKFQGR